MAKFAFLDARRAFFSNYAWRAQSQFTVVFLALARAAAQFVAVLVVAQAAGVVA